MSRDKVNVKYRKKLKRLPIYRRLKESMQKPEKGFLIIIIILGILLAFIYFSFPFAIITPDGIEYYKYLKIFSGQETLSNWNTIRGPSMPIVLYLITAIWGDTKLGFITGTFFFLLITIYFGFLLIRESLKKQEKKAIKVIIWILFVILFLFNPLIIGYYHVLLTEFVTATVAVLSCFFAIKWIHLRIEENIFKTLVFSFIFLFLSVFMWFVKQPYITASFIPLFLGTCLSILKIRTWKNTLYKSLLLLLCLISVFLSILLWDKIITSYGGSSSALFSRESFSQQLIRGASNFREIPTEDSDYQNTIESSEYLNKKEKELIKDIRNGNSEYRRYIFYEVLSIRDSMVIDIIVVPLPSQEGINIEDALSFFSIVGREYPKHLLASYVSNYLAIINLTFIDHSNVVPIKDVIHFKDWHGENELIGLAIYYSYSSVLGNLPLVMPYAVESTPQFIVNLEPMSLLQTPLLKLFIRSSLLLLTITLVLAPLLFFYFLLRYLIKNERKEKQKHLSYEILIVLLGYSFIHVLLHAFLGAVIDRYSFVAYPTAILGILSYLALLDVKRIREKIHSKKSHLKEITSAMR